MSKQTAKTLQMRLGFLDEDLKKPEHDEIIKWMDKNIHSIVSELFIKPDWTQDEIKSIEAKAEKLIKDESLLFRIKRTVDDLDQELRRETQDEKRKEIRGSLITRFLRSKFSILFFLAIFCQFLLLADSSSEVLPLGEASLAPIGATTPLIDIP